MILPTMVTCNVFFQYYITTPLSQYGLGYISIIDHVNQSVALMFIDSSFNLEADL